MNLIAIVNIKLLIIPLLFLSLLTMPALAQFGPGPRPPGTSLDSIVAVVEDDIITLRELDLALERVQNQIRRRGSKAPDDTILRRQVLERLISDRLQVRAAERRGIVVDDQTLNAAIESIAERNNISLNELRRRVELDGFTFAQFREDVHRQVLIERLRQRVVDSQVQVSEREVDNWLARNASGREFNLAQILVGVPEGASPDEIDAARATSEEILEKLRQGADFRRLAAEFSAGRRALEGGDLGWLSASQLPGPIADSVLRLQPGEFSQPIRSPRGFYIVQLLGVRDASGAKVDSTEQRNAARQALFRSKVEEEWELWLRRLQDESYIEIRL